MHPASLPFLHGARDKAPVIMRVLVGIIMTAHGWQKLTAMGPANFGAGMLEPAGIPAPTLLGWAITWIELAGGILLIVGLFTRISAVLISLILVGAIFIAKVDIGLIAGADAPLPGAELDLALLAGLIGVALLGPGKPSLDHQFSLEGHHDDAATPVGARA